MSNEIGYEKETLTIQKSFIVNPVTVSVRINLDRIRQTMGIWIMQFRNTYHDPTESFSHLLDHRAHSCDRSNDVGI